MTISMNEEKPVVDATNNVEDIPKNSDGNDTHQVDVEEGSQGDANENQVEEDEPKDRAGCYKKLILGLLLLGFIIFVIVDTQTNNYVRDVIFAFLEWIEQNVVAGVFAFMAVYFVATIFWVPGLILTLGAGFVFSAALDSLGRGILLGTVAVWFGASSGAIAAFLLGRYLFRDGFVGRLSKKYAVFEALDKAMEEKGLLIMCLLRLAPIVPFNVLNYVAGVLAVSFWQYTIACVAMLPGTIFYVFLGASAGSLAALRGDDNVDEMGEDIEEEDNGRVTLIVTVVTGVVFGLAATIAIGFYTKKQLNKILDAQAEATAAEEQNNASVKDGDEAEDAEVEEAQA